MTLGVSHVEWGLGLSVRLGMPVFSEPYTRCFAGLAVLLRTSVETAGCPSHVPQPWAFQRFVDAKSQSADAPGSTVALDLGTCISASCIGGPGKRSLSRPQGRLRSLIRQGRNGRPTGEGRA